MADSALQPRSLVKDDGLLELSLARVEVPTPKADQVVVRIEATPINPSATPGTRWSSMALLRSQG